MRARALSTSQEGVRGEAASAGDGITALRNEQAAKIGGSVKRGKKINADYKDRFKVFTSHRVFLIYLELNLWCPGIWIAI